MRIKVYFTKNTEPVPCDEIREKVNGFLNSVLGKNNKYHGARSFYATSPLLGGHRMDKYGKFYTYPEGGYIIVSCPKTNMDFLGDFVGGLCMSNSWNMFGMTYDGYDMYSTKTGEKYDILTVYNIAIRKDGERKWITMNDENYIKFLQEKCVQKLTEFGVSYDEAKTLKLEGKWEYKWRNVNVHVKNNTEHANIVNTSSVKIIIKGKRNVREIIKDLGFGNMTGYGFGFAASRNEIINR